MHIQVKFNIYNKVLRLTAVPHCTEAQLLPLPCISMTLHYYIMHVSDGIYTFPCCTTCTVSRAVIGVHLHQGLSVWPFLCRHMIYLRTTSFVAGSCLHMHRSIASRSLQLLQAMTVSIQFFILSHLVTVLIA